MVVQHLLLFFGYLYIGGMIGLIYVYAAGKDPGSFKHSLYSVWPTAIGLLGFVVVALLVK
jgi:hypothetical protein